jgi:hypothetical protein
MTNAGQPLGGPPTSPRWYKDLTRSLASNIHSFIFSWSQKVPGTHYIIWEDLYPPLNTPVGVGDRLFLPSLVLAGSRSPAFATSPTMDLVW